MGIFNNLRSSISNTYKSIDSKIFKGALPGGSEKEKTLRSSTPTTKTTTSTNINTNKKKSSIRETANKVLSTGKRAVSQAYKTADKYAFAGLLPNGAKPLEMQLEQIDTIQNTFRERSLRKQQEKIDYQTQKLNLDQQETDLTKLREDQKIKQDLNAYSWYEYFDKNERALNEQRRSNESANIQIDLSSDKSEIQKAGELLGIDPYKELQNQISSSQTSFIDKFKSGVGDFAPWLIAGLGAVFLLKKR